ncbi:MAG: mannose-6-phosphate isomerase [Marinilabiliales bacterium]|nr:MAG: mannose-6-phosphate isomerase [Marinilabiliales bacterium]
MNNLYPLKFKPIFKDKIWGGQRIKAVLGMDSSPLPNCGEAWLISSVEGNISVVENGFLAGNALNELIEIYMDDLLGEKVFEKHKEEFPLLIKIIDANDWLSIQVHPDDKLAQKYKYRNGKTEMWYVMHNDDSAQLISGFKRDTNSREYLDLLEKNQLQEVLNYEKTNKGDIFFMPAGRIHSLGPGNLIAEIQQTSDTTYRIYDWDRVDEKGNSRELHLKKAMEAIDFKAEETYKTTYSKKQNETVEAVSCPYFTTNVITLTKPLGKNLESMNTFVVYICTEGEGTITYGGGELPIRAGESCLIPAELEGLMFRPQGKMTLLEVYVI